MKIVQQFWAVLCAADHPNESAASKEDWCGPYANYQAAESRITEELGTNDGRYFSGHVCKRLTAIGTARVRQVPPPVESADA